MSVESSTGERTLVDPSGGARRPPVRATQVRSPRRSSSWSTAAPYAAPAAVAAVFATMAWAHRWLHEDGLINVRIVENLVAGRGPVFNPGERIEAFTSPAQIAALSLGRIATLGMVRIETVVFVLGVGSSVLGFWLVMRGAMHLWGADAPGKLNLPLGAIVFVAVPLTWDFATSGHEGSIGYLWVGAAFFGLARRARERRVRFRSPIDRPRWLLLVLGSGALVRPELALFSGAFLAAWLFLHWRSRGSRLAALGWAIGPTVAYQVFRMGYFALVLPNTALAKLGGPLGASEGWHFLSSFVSPFVLWLPVALLVVVGARLTADGDAPQRAVVAAMVVPALAQVGYLVSIGGDYVNGRLLVVPFLALVAPVAVVPTSVVWTRRHRVDAIGGFAVATLLVWAAVSATQLRPPWKTDGNDFLDSRFDARELAIRNWTFGKVPTRITVYRDSFLAQGYKRLVEARALGAEDVLIVEDPYVGQVVLLPPGEGAVIAGPAIGALGALAGPDVRIIDTRALADPIASHLPTDGDTPGHLRLMSEPWVFGRMGLALDPAAAAATKVLSCGDVRTLMRDTTGPLTIGRFASNLLDAPRNTSLKIPTRPEAAAEEFC